MNQPKAEHLTRHDSLLRREQRENLLGQRGCVVWLTGLSGSGKSTIAHALERRLVGDGRFAYVLDGDNVRYGLCRDLGFAEADRRENIRRIGEVARLFADAGGIAIAAFISPYRAEREAARALAGDRPFIEVHLATPLAACEARDVKGLYAKARRGELTGLTGLDAPYEAPRDPELVLDTAVMDLERCVGELIAAVYARGVVYGENQADGAGI